MGCREQRQPGAFGADRPVTVLSEEALHGLALPLGDHVVQPLGDADRGVVVTDLGLVVPKHRQAAIVAQPTAFRATDLADTANTAHDDNSENTDDEQEACA